MPYLKDVDALTTLLKQNPTWSAIKPEHAARMRAQNKFQTGLDIAKYTAKIMREDMANYDNDTSQVHPVPGLLARFHRPAEDDFH